MDLPTHWIWFYVIVANDIIRFAASAVYNYGSNFLLKFIDL